MKNYYQILGLEPTAAQEEIKRKYREYASKFHPDIHQGDSFFKERFQEIQEAYDTLKNSQRKEEYDFNFFRETNNKEILSPVIVSFTSSQQEISIGDIISIKWEVINAKRVIIHLNNGEKVIAYDNLPISGVKNIKPTRFKQRIQITIQVIGFNNKEIRSELYINECKILSDIQKPSIDIKVPKEAFPQTLVDILWIAKNCKLISIEIYYFYEGTKTKIKSITSEKTNTQEKATFLFYRQCYINIKLTGNDNEIVSQEITINAIKGIENETCYYDFTISKRTTNLSSKKKKQKIVIASTMLITYVVVSIIILLLDIEKIYWIRFFIFYILSLAPVLYIFRRVTKKYEEK